LWVLYLVSQDKDEGSAFRRCKTACLTLRKGRQARGGPQSSRPAERFDREGRRFFRRRPHRETRMRRGQYDTRAGDGGFPREEPGGICGQTNSPAGRSRPRRGRTPTWPDHSDARPFRLPSTDGLPSRATMAHRGRPAKPPKSSRGSIPSSRRPSDSCWGLTMASAIPIPGVTSMNSPTASIAGRGSPSCPCAHSIPTSPHTSLRMLRYGDGHLNL